MKMTCSYRPFLALGLLALLAACNGDRWESRNSFWHNYDSSLVTALAAPAAMQQPQK